MACPVEGFPGRSSSQTALWFHFVHFHVRNTTVVLEEGNQPHLLCHSCGMFVPWKALHSHHPVMEICAKGMERKRRWRVEEDTHAGFVTVFQSYGRPIAMVSLFKYPGRVLTAS